MAESVNEALDEVRAMNLHKVLIISENAKEGGAPVIVSYNCSAAMRLWMLERAKMIVMEPYTSGWSG